MSISVYFHAFPVSGVSCLSIYGDFSGFTSFLRILVYFSIILSTASEYMRLPDNTLEELTRRHDDV